MEIDACSAFDTWAMHRIMIISRHDGPKLGHCIASRTRHGCAYLFSDFRRQQLNIRGETKNIYRCLLWSYWRQKSRKRTFIVCIWRHKDVVNLILYLTFWYCFLLCTLRACFDCICRSLKVVTPVLWLRTWGHAPPPKFCSYVKVIVLLYLLKFTACFEWCCDRTVSNTSEELKHAIESVFFCLKVCYRRKILISLTVVIVGIYFLQFSHNIDLYIMILYHD